MKASKLTIKEREKKLKRQFQSLKLPKRTNPKDPLEVRAWAELDAMWTTEFNMSYREVLEREAEQQQTRLEKTARRQRKLLRKKVKHQMKMCEVLFNDLDNMLASI
jgi:hypothetical protein